MPRNNYGFQKRQKELKRQTKQEEKRQRKLERANAQPEEPPEDDSGSVPEAKEE